MLKIDYKQSAFVMVKPPSRVISYHLIRSAVEYQKLVGDAITSGYCLYYAPIAKKNGKIIAKQPWLLDDATIPIIKAPELAKVIIPVEVLPSDGLFCPFCKKTMASTSGRTLHVKSHHADQLKEYELWLKSLGKRSSKKQPSR